MRATEKQISKMKKVTKAEIENIKDHMRNYYVFNPYIGWQMVHAGFESKNHYETILNTLKMKESAIKEIRLDNRKMA